jgi:hypothetical protein
LLTPIALVLRGLGIRVGGGDQREHFLNIRLATCRDLFPNNDGLPTRRARGRAENLTEGILIADLRPDTPLVEFVANELHQRTGTGE